MHRATACLVAVVQNGHWIRARIGIRPPGDGLALGIRPQLLPLKIAQFVMRAEIRRLKSRAALQANHFHARLAKFGREYSASRANSNDDDVRFFGGHVIIPSLSGLKLSPADQPSARV